MNFQRLFDLFYYQQAKYPRKKALSTKQGLSWKSYDTKACLTEIECISAGLLQLGLERGDKFAIITNQASPIWTFLDLGMQQIGVIVVPLPATLSRKDLLYILNDAQIKYCIVQDREGYQKVKEIQTNILSLKKIYTVERLPDVANWEELSIAPTSNHLATIQALKAAIHEDDLATIVYTSGTTAHPKGVMLSHKNIVSNIKANIENLPLNCDKIVLSFLPISHLFERLMTYTYIATGASLHYVQSVDLIVLADHTKEIRPHYFTMTASLLEGIYQYLKNYIETLPKFKKRIYKWAIKTGENYPDHKFSIVYWWKSQLAYFLVFRKWQSIMGGRIEGVLINGAMLRPSLNRLFTAAGFLIIESYGLVETAAMITSNSFDPRDWRVSTAGLPLANIELKIKNEANDPTQAGEILVRGSNIMLGYYNKPTLTAQVLDQDAWLKTSDIGQIVEGRFLQIIGRKATVFETSNKVKIVPQAIENLLYDIPYIEQCLVVGAQRPYLGVLIVPNFELLKIWCKKNGLIWVDTQDMILSLEVDFFFKTIITDFNKQLLPHQQIQQAYLLTEKWTTENHLLTPNLKIKRAKILEHCAREIEEMYRT